MNATIWEKDPSFIDAEANGQEVICSGSFEVENWPPLFLQSVVYACAGSVAVAHAALGTMRNFLMQMGD